MNQEEINQTKENPIQIEKPPTLEQKKEEPIIEEKQEENKTNKIENKETGKFIYF
jgi:hypothetical protein